ncbi:MULTISPECIES: MlaE family ABC transporter permease [Commensalibacter]|uniref:MlaE family ABC transporter permease n=1 Tax=Commensalibacter TaxID=1079922 RepID=UPI0018DEA77A|nr:MULTISPECIES: ABC transporter permease [Commensalibacter]MBH9973515.1 ABC transporter permease [Commensalibacter melissae]MBI0017337.1 ABC transporter permease [Commensalibacter sp. B14384M2]MBI0018941.1 ABC transporter permease [Commensalibacter sp. W8133]MBI0049367.1 ABC transporter permease [Commensalibacter sp. B14384M3]MBI0179425.1 ABC transporter permease [Commensalibacter sp. W8163]
MSDINSDQQPQWKLEQQENHYVISLSGQWLAKNNNIPRFSPKNLERIPAHQTLYFDARNLKNWDSGLIVFLWDIKCQATKHSIKFSDKDLPASAQELLSLLHESKDEAPVKHSSPFRPLYMIGEWTINGLTNLGITVQMLKEVIIGILKSLTGRSYMRIVDLISDVQNAGPSALLIISVVNFLVGAILGFVGAVQLRRFAADAYVANLVSIATVREMAAVMSAIVISGRTGGAYAARISTMQGNEEIDALKVMGVSIMEYLILPSMLSLVITMPILYLYGCFMGILGGLIVSIFMLKVSIIGFLQQSFGAVAFNQFVFGGLKTVSFAIFIGVSSCYIGLKSGRSAVDVGLAATKAVVTGIVGVIAIDAIFAVIADMIGI